MGRALTAIQLIASQAVLGTRRYDASPAKRGGSARSLHGPGQARAFHHNGLLRCSVNDENMMLKLMLIRWASLVLASTECSR